MAVIQGYQYTYKLEVMQEPWPQEYLTLGPIIEWSVIPFGHSGITYRICLTCSFATMIVLLGHHTGEKISVLKHQENIDMVGGYDANIAEERIRKSGSNTSGDNKAMKERMDCQDLRFSLARLVCQGIATKPRFNSSEHTG
jgi:hypothetical protein